MADLFVLFITLTVFGVGVTIIDFLGVLDHWGDNSGDHFSDHSDSHSADTGSEHGSNLIAENKHSAPDKPSFSIISKIMNLLRNAVYFSLGSGPTGLFAYFNGLSRTSGLIWAFAVGAAMIILARLLKRFIRRDLDSSIKTDELLQEKGVLLLPLEGETISKAMVRQYGREIEVFVRCKDKNSKLPKGKEVIIDEYEDDVYWVVPKEFP
ncbi:MAG: hypothetical protein FWC19_07355 [Treponema sp.]|nr:hypothetical protein [Treponema sp.]MCL2272597.1 hypothetical protein [Treponema sp.]